MSEPATIPALVRAAAERFGDRHAIEDGDVTLTFRELAAAGLRAARAFMAAGLRRGDRAAIWAPNIHEWVVAAIGLQTAGGVLVPLNTRMKGREVGYILEKSGARILCAVEEFLGNRYLDLLRDGCGGSGRGRPVADLPALCRPIAATIHSWMFGAQIATRSPRRIPAAAKARAARSPAAASSRNVSVTAPSSIAWRPAKRSPAASTRAGMVRASGASSVMASGTARRDARSRRAPGARCPRARTGDAAQPP